MKLSPQFRMLQTPQQFRAVYQEGQRFHSSFYTAFVKANETGELRLGITVTRKTGNAVLRNRCKRRVKAIFRTRPFVLPESFGCDIVINAKATLAAGDFAALSAAFERTFTQALTFLQKQQTVRPSTPNATAEAALNPAAALVEAPSDELSKA